MPLLTSVSDSRSFGRGGLPVFGWVTSTVIDVVEGTTSSLTFTATNPLGGTFTYALQSGTFPTGTTFNSNGTLTGTFPNETSDTLYPVTIRATSSLGSTSDKTFDLTVRTGTVSWTTAEGNIGSSLEGSAFSETVEATTNTPGTISYAVTTGSLPSGLSLDSSTGAITGTSPEVGANTDVTFSITATDTFGSSSSRSFTITVTNGIISWTTAEGNIGSSIEGSSFSQTVEATTNTLGTISYAVTTGSLPSGLSLNSSTGEISGTAPAVGSDTDVTFSITASDTFGNSASRSFTITTTNGSVSWSTAGGSLGDVEEGDAFSITVSATTTTDGTISYSVTSGSLPSGLSLNTSTGAITGTASEVGSDTESSFTLTASDTFGNSATRNFLITVTNGSVSWSTAGGSLGSVEEGSAFSRTLSATTTTSGTISYSVTTGSLPGGLSLNSATGAITGTANSVGADTDSDFTVTASDTFGNSATRDFTITVTNIPARTVTLTVYGAQGGSNGGNDPGGQGGTVTWTGVIEVGISLTLYVASAGGNSNNSVRGGGGGGGASAVLIGSNVLAIGGGGGGAGADGDGGDNTTGGRGGADTGETGGNSTHAGSANGGTGGTQSAVGTGGTGSRGNGINGSGRNGGNGSGAVNGTFPRGWGYGNGGLGALYNGDGGSGGGGGGYFGGGSGGRDASGAGGGGGSNYRRTSGGTGYTYSSSTTTRGGRTGNGRIVVNVAGVGSTTFNYVSEATQSYTIP